MENTRVQILADLEDWAQDPSAPKVYWLNGHLGTGKTSIAHTLSKRLDAKQMLGASFFCSRTALRDARVIIPTIASILSRSNPKIRSALCEVLGSNPDVADLNSLPEQFSSLLVKPIKRVIGNDIKVYKIIVIDALDECSSTLDERSSRWTVLSFIATILDGVADIPLKFFVLSRPEDWIKSAFRHKNAPSLLRIFSLHDVAKSDVQRDIEVYLRSAFSEIAEGRRYSRWPPEQELMTLLTRSDGLFIYAATAVRYIGAPDVNSQQRLTKIARPGPASVLQSNTIDSLYGMIMDQAFDKLEDGESIWRQEVLASVVLFQTPLSIAGITSLLGIPNDQAEADLSPFHSVIHVPSTVNGHVSIFHASFREYIVDPARYGHRHGVNAPKGHEILTVKCLQFLNRSLRRNICNLPEDTIGALPHEITDLSVIPEALQYSCLHWASHLVDTLADPPADIAPALEHLRTFADEHVLHWFECLSAFGELESGLKSLAKANEAISVSAHDGEMFWLTNPVEILYNSY